MQKKFLTRKWRAAAIVVPVVLAASAAVVAGANMASASPQPGSLSGTGGTIYYSAGTGTLNNVVIRNAAGGGIEVEDLSQEITLANPFGGCVSVTASLIRCPATYDRVFASLADGNDAINASGISLETSIMGSDGNDTIIGSQGADTITGGLGSDAITANLGADTIHGNEGNDNINGGDGYDTITGDAGNDVLNGGLGNDNITGGDNEDTISAGGGNDVVSGLKGDDVLYGGAGNDTINGGDGTDSIYGGTGVDTLNGDNGSDTVHGGDDGDMLKRRRRRLFGDAAPTASCPAPGTRTTVANGIDTMDYSSLGGQVWVTLDDSENDGPFPCDDWIGCPVVTYHNVHSDVEKVIGTKDNDRIIGNDQDNFLDGGPGNDTLEGKGGDDYLDAEGGNGQRDFGGPGDDTCVGFNITRYDCEH